MKIKLLLIVVLIFGFSNPSAIADSKYPKTDSQAIDDAFMVGIEQFKAKGHKITRQEIKIDASNGSHSHASIIEDFTPDYSGEVVFVNKYEGRFKSFQPKGTAGGFLWWIRDDTYIRMDSQVLTKKEMLKLAKSMK